jgi:multiple sugar transport system substrate-binding protein
MLIAVMLWTACGGSEEQTPSPAAVPTTVPTEAAAQPTAEQERTTIRFAISDFEAPIYEDLIAAFEEENPDLHVQVVSINEVLGLGPIGDTDVPDDAEQRLAAAADVVSIGVSRAEVEQGLVRDLTPFIESDPNFDADDFFADSLASYQWDGGTWALPATANVRLIFFNKDAFDEAGVPYPEAGWTWDDLLVKAQALTVGEGDEVSQWGFVSPHGIAYRIIESRVGRMVDDSAEPPMPQFDSSDVADAVRWYTDLVLAEEVMPYFELADGEEEPAMSEEEVIIDEGRAAMWPEIDLLFGYRQQQGNIGVAPFPADTPNWPANAISTDGFSMSAGTNQPEAAWRWIEFLSRQTLGSLGLGMTFMPARASAAETSGYWDDVDEELAAALRYALDHGYATREPVGYSAFDDAIRAILKGEKSVADALADAQTQAETDIQEAMAEQAGATPVPTFVVAPPEEEKPVSEDAVTITYVPGLGSFNLEPYRDLADRFAAENPDVVVEVKMFDFTGGGTPGLPDLAKGSDCFQWFPSFQAPENREAILNLEPFLDADPDFSTDGFYPQVLEQFTWQGQLWGLPADITPFIIEYNKDVFDAAGVDYPTTDWTWDDFLETAVALTQGEDEAKQYGYVAEVYELNDLLLMVERLGAKLVDADADPPALSFNDPDTVEAMRWYANLTTEHQVKPAYVTDITKLLGASSAYLEREALINDGQAAMWTNSPSTAALFGDREGLNLGAAPLPVRADGTSSSSFTGASGNFISAQTDHKQACWRWITFLAGQPSAVQGLPANRSVAESSAFREQVGAERADAYLASVGEGDQPSTFQIFSEEEWLGGALFWFGQAYGKVIEGETSVEEALDVAQQFADDYRACLVAKDDFGEEAWQACAQEIDPSLPSFLFGQ